MLESTCFRKSSAEVRSCQPKRERERKIEAEGRGRRKGGQGKIPSLLNCHVIAFAVAAA
jgi:hypothetical protein